MTLGYWHPCTARLTFRRPPVDVFVANAATWSTLSSSSALSSAVVAAHIDSTSMAAPDTCGVAIDVPCSVPYALFGIVEWMALPGAARWTDEAP